MLGSFRLQDWFFLAILGAGIMLAGAAVKSEMSAQVLLTKAGGSRKIDLQQVRKQIDEGHLSPKKALFQRTLPNR